MNEEALELFATITMIPAFAEKEVTGKVPDDGVVCEGVMFVTALAFIKRPELMYDLFKFVNDDTAYWIDEHLDQLEALYENSH